MTSFAVPVEIAQKKTERDCFVRLNRKDAKRREEMLARSSGSGSAPQELTNLCLMLHELAQRYVPRTAQTFRDFDALTQVTNALQKMGLEPSIAPEVCAAARSVDCAVVLNSPEYRHLHNRFVAALATIADMTEKNTPPGPPEYQRGVREGYRRASDIAILFLEDLQLRTKQ